MSRGSNGLATRYSSTPEGAPIQKFANGSLTSRIWTEQAAGLLTDKDLAQKVLELSPEDQAKFVDKVDQVRRDCLFSPLKFASLFLYRRILPSTRKTRDA